MAGRELRRSWSRTPRITVSGLAPEDKDRVIRLAGELGFMYLPVLTAPDHNEPVTHVVADSVMTSKYREAVRIRVPVVSVRWIDESYARGAALDEGPYLLPPFHKLKIVPTGAHFSRSPGVPNRMRAGVAAFRPCTCRWLLPHQVSTWRSETS